MKIVQINTVCYGSTGKIMKSIAIDYQKKGYECLCIYGRGKGYNDINCVKVGGVISFLFHVFISLFFGKNGHGSYFKTKRIINILKKEKPNIIHLHNIHGYYLNYPLLFNYLKDYKGEIKWTFHDCWPVTGHCAHFTIAKCYKWKKCCNNCPNKRKYPYSFIIDSSKKEYLLKKKCFTSVKKMTIIVPSNWLKRIVEQSYFSHYNIVVKYNNIDRNVFKYIYDPDVLTKYDIPHNKKIILGVANVWTKEKGINVFLNLANQITDDYCIVLVGLNNKQIAKYKKHGIIGIKRTNNQEELAKIYSIANVYVNPSIEETFSMTTYEALACKTPVIVYENTPMEEYTPKNFVISENKEITLELINDIIKSKDLVE